MQSAEPLLYLRESVGQPLHLGGRLGGVTLRVGSAALRVALPRACLKLRLARSFGLRRGGEECGFRGRELGQGALELLCRAGVACRRVAHLLLEALELGPALQRSASVTPAPPAPSTSPAVQEHGAVRPA